MQQYNVYTQSKCWQGETGWFVSGPSPHGRGNPCEWDFATEEEARAFAASANAGNFPKCPICGHWYHTEIYCQKGCGCENETWNWIR